MGGGGEVNGGERDAAGGDVGDAGEGFEGGVAGDAGLDVGYDVGDFGGEGGVADDEAGFGLPWGEGRGWGWGLSVVFCWTWGGTGGITSEYDTCAEE